MNGNEPLLTYQQSRDLDTKTMAAGWTSTQLMGQAALSSLYRLMQKPAPEEIIFLCGPGNNGGDGLALAYHILSSAAQGGFAANCRLKIIQTAPAKSEASRFYESLLQDRLSLHAPDALLNESASQGSGPSETIPRDKLLIVEALLGSGQDRPLEGMFRSLCEWIAKKQEEGARVLSLDVPAGLLEDRPFGQTGLFVPDEVHTYGPHRLPVALSVELLSGAEIYSNPIGFFPEMVSAWFRVKRDPTRLELFQRSVDSHKYSNGAGWILGGSSQMEGALLLSAGCFFASGGGILSCMSTSESPLYLSEASLMQKSELKADERTGAIVAGPGCSQEDALRYLQTLSNRMESSNALESSNVFSVTEQDRRHPALVLDAAVAVRSLGFPVLHGPNTLLTPHPGEWKSMGGPPIHDVKSLQDSLEFAIEKVGSFVLYKGQCSVLLDPFARKALLFPWPNSNLAVAGTGDCLTGILMTALCRGADMQKAVKASMELLHSATERSLNPTSSRFPELIRLTLASASLKSTDKSTDAAGTITEHSFYHGQPGMDDDSDLSEQMIHYREPYRKRVFRGLL